MPRGSRTTALGRLDLRTGGDGVDLERAARLGLELVGKGTHRGEFIAFGPRAGYLKASPLRGRSARRHGLRAALLRAHPPRLQEFANLLWLREAGFGAPLPLAAGVLWRRGLPRFQFLVTERLADTETLDVALEAADATRRAAIVDGLASEVARMHARGFVHRDLFPRNILVGGPEGANAVSFIDAWAGGPGLQRRGPTYDLACLFLESAVLLTPGEQRRFLDTYAGLGGRASVRETTTIERIRRQREALLARLRRDPQRLHGRPLPGPWPPPEVVSGTCVESSPRARDQSHRSPRAGDQSDRVPSNRP